MQDMFENTTKLKYPFVQNTTQAAIMKITDLLAAKRVTTPVSISRDPTKGDEMDTISLQMKLLNTLVTAYGRDGKPVADQKKPDVSR